MTEHELMLERVRASDRQWCESDLYWRTDRWAEDGRGYLGPIVVIDGRENVGRSSVVESFNKAMQADILAKYRR